jgi:hypothetical protein
MDEILLVNDPVRMVKSAWLDDWYIIERAEHDGQEWLEPIGEPNAQTRGYALMRSARISNADVEGTMDEMVEIAKAIKSNGTFHAKRCAVDATGSRVKLWSPRNSLNAGSILAEAADELAEQILKEAP